MNDVPDTELFSAYLDGEVTAAEQVRVEQMLAVSPEARQLLEELRALGSTVQGLPLEKLDEDLSARVLEIAERRMLLPVPLSEERAGNKPSAGRAAEALETPDAEPIGWLGVPWREISWRGMFSKRALIWSGVIAATALIIFFNSPPPQKPNLQQAKLEEQAKSLEPAADELDRPANSLDDFAKGREKKVEKVAEAHDASAVAGDGTKLSRDSKAGPSWDALSGEAKKRLAESEFSAKKGGPSPSESLSHGDAIHGDTADDTSRKVADGSADGKKAHETEEVTRSDRLAKEKESAETKTEDRSLAFKERSATKNPVAEKEGDSPAPLVRKPGANEVAKDAVPGKEAADEAKTADKERPHDAGKAALPADELAKSSPAPAAGEMPSEPVAAAEPAPATPATPAAPAALGPATSPPPVGNPVLSLSGTAPMSVATSPSHASLKPSGTLDVNGAGILTVTAGGSLNMAASGTLGAITMNSGRLQGKGGVVFSDAGSNTVAKAGERNQLMNDGGIATPNGASQFGGSTGVGGTSWAGNVNGAQFNGGRGPANRAAGQKAPAATVVYCDISASALQKKVFETVLAHNGLLIDQNGTNLASNYSGGNFNNGRFAQQDQGNHTEGYRGGGQEQYKAENAADSSSPQYERNPLAVSNSAASGSVARLPDVTQAAPPAAQDKYDNGKRDKIGKSPIPAATTPVPADATAASPAAAAPATAAPAAKADLDGQQKMVSKLERGQASKAKAPEAQAVEKPSPEIVAALQTRNVQALRPANSQPLVFECDASLEQLVSVIKQIRDKSESFSPPMVQADGLNSAEMLSLAQFSINNSSAYNANSSSANSPGAYSYGTNTYGGPTNLGTSGAYALGANNTFSGSTTLSAGTLNIRPRETQKVGTMDLGSDGKPNNLPSQTLAAGSANIGGSGALDYYRADQTQQAGGMNLSGGISGSRPSQTEKVAPAKPGGLEADNRLGQTQEAGAANLSGGTLDTRRGLSLQGAGGIGGGGAGGGGMGGGSYTVREDAVKAQTQSATSGEGRGQGGQLEALQPQSPLAPDFGVARQQPADAGALAARAPRQHVVFVLNVVDRVVPAASRASQMPAAPAAPASSQ